MPELNDKQVVEATRTEVHQQDVTSFKELTKAINENSVALTEHCYKQTLHDQSVDNTLKGLSYLAEDDVKFVLKEIVKKQEAVGVIMPIVFKWVLWISAFITFFYLAIKFGRDLLNIK